MTGSDPEKVSEEFFRNGYSIVEGLFSPAEVTAIRTLAERLPGYLAGDYMPAMNPHKLVPELLDVMGDERLLRIMRRLMKGTPQGLQTQFFSASPGRAASRPIRTITMCRRLPIASHRPGSRSTTWTARMVG
jgi:hypothetical protein